MRTKKQKMTTEELVIWIRKLIKHNNVRAFYKTTDWVHLSQEVLKEQHYECQLCKEKGIYQTAKTVHHVHFVRHIPRLALSKYDDNGKRNLIAVCESCHNNIHHSKQSQGFTTPERW